MASTSGITKQFGASCLDSGTVLKQNSVESMEFYREGFLNKAGKGIQKHVHSWRPRYFVLDDSWQLKYYKSKDIWLENNLLGSIDVPEIESVSVMKHEKNSFQITTKAPTKRTYYMSGKSEVEVEGWIKCLQMAKAKYLEKQKKSNEVPSVYDEVNYNLSPPPKPERSLIVSGSDFPEPSQSPATPNSPGSPTSKATASGIKPVISAYQSFHFPSDDTIEKPEEAKAKDVKLEEDPTYDTVDEKAASKSSNNSEPSADLYDTVDSTISKSPAKKMNRASDPLPQAAVPPPLPARLPSMSAELEEKTEEESKEREEDKKQSQPSKNGAGIANSGSEKPKPEQEVFGVYDEVGSPDSALKTDQKSQPSGDANLYDEVRTADTADTAESGNKNSNGHAENASDLYDDVTTPNLPLDSGNKISQVNGLYDEVGNRDDLPAEVIKEENNAPIFDPTHVYAKPDKSSSMKRGHSKRKLIPGLMDVGEVDIDIEEDAAGGKETLQRGMTKPQGDRFAIEDLREALEEFDKEANNNEHGVMLPDFDVNQSDSAFEVLRIFLERYE